MTLKLADDLRQAIESQGGTPVYLVDSTSCESYVLLRVSQYEKLKTLLEEHDERFDPAMMYPLIEQSFGKAGWDAPEMDDYNAYDENRSKA
jgi:hypothetical protein